MGWDAGAPCLGFAFLLFFTSFKFNLEISVMNVIPRTRERVSFQVSLMPTHAHVCVHRHAHTCKYMQTHRNVPVHTHACIHTQACTCTCTLLVLLWPSPFQRWACSFPPSLSASISSFSVCFLSAYSITGPALAAGDTAVENIHKDPTLKELTSLGADRH